MAFRGSAPVLAKVKKLFPGVFQEIQRQIANEPERVVRRAGMQGIGMVSLPHLLQKRIKEFLSDRTPRLLRRDVADLSARLRIYSGGTVPINERKDWRGKFPRKKHTDESEEDKQARLEGFDITAENFDLLAPGKVLRAHGRGSLEYDATAAAAYVAARMPSSFAALVRVLKEVSARIPTYKPMSLLDFGSGPGTSFWAAQYIWPDTWRRLAAVETSTDMANACSSLLEGVEHFPRVQHYANLQNLSRDLRGEDRLFDVVIASYSLGELSSDAARTNTVRRLWSHTRHLLVLVEAGNPRGWSTVQTARMEVLREAKRKKLKDERAVSKDGEARDSKEEAPLEGGAHTVSPCPHDASCPMQGTASWCHFGQHLQRSEVQRLAKTAGHQILKQQEVEKFAYVVIRRGPRPIVTSPLTQLKRRNELQQFTGSGQDLVNLKRKHLKGGLYGQILISDMSKGLPGSSAKQRAAEGGEGNEVDENEEEGNDVASSAIEDVNGQLSDGDQVDKWQHRREAETDGDRFEGDEEADEDNGEEAGEAGEGDEEADGNDDEELEGEGDEGSEDGENDVPVVAEVGSTWARIVREPRRRGAHAIIDLCSPRDLDGTRARLERHIYTKKDGIHVYRMARKTEWGDIWPC